MSQCPSGTSSKHASKHHAHGLPSQLLTMHPAPIISTRTQSNQSQHFYVVWHWVGQLHVLRCAVTGYVIHTFSVSAEKLIACLSDEVEKVCNLEKYFLRAHEVSDRLCVQSPVCPKRGVIYPARTPVRVAPDCPKHRVNVPSLRTRVRSSHSGWLS